MPFPMVFQHRVLLWFLHQEMCLLHEDSNQPTEEETSPVEMLPAITTPLPASVLLPAT